MEKRNLFVSGKAVVAAVCGAFTAAFGWLGWLKAQPGPASGTRPGWWSLFWCAP